MGTKQQEYGISTHYDTEMAEPWSFFGAGKSGEMSAVNGVFVKTWHMSAKKNDNSNTFFRACFFFTTFVFSF